MLATTFATIAYIVVVNPAILGFAGIVGTTTSGAYIEAGVLVLAAVCAAYYVFGLPH